MTLLGRSTHRPWSRALRGMAAVLTVGAATELPGVAYADPLPDAAESTPSGVSVRPGDSASPIEPFRPSLAVTAELIGGLSVQTEESFSEFELYRAELGTLLRPTRYAGAEVRLEAVRSATGRSLLGVDGNSLVLRVRRAYGWGHGWLGPIHVEGRLGLVPDPWTEAVEAHYDFRGFAPLLGDTGQFFDTGDFGAGVVLRGPADWLGSDAARASVTVTNGEGRTETERNNGKNLTAVVSLQPVVATLWAQPLRVGVHGAYRQGSSGFGEARSNRTAAGFTAHHPRAELGVEWISAHGYLGDGSVRASGLGVWGGGQIMAGWLGVMARADWVTPDGDVEDADRQVISAALFTDLGQTTPAAEASIFGRVRFHLGVQAVSAGELAGPLPGLPEAAQQTRILFSVASTGGGILR